eukprot:6016672-Amphidinium_carterae.2
MGRVSVSCCMWVLPGGSQVVHALFFSASVLCEAAASAVSKYDCALSRSPLAISTYVLKPHASKPEAVPTRLTSDCPINPDAILH